MNDPRDQVDIDGIPGSQKPGQRKSASGSDVGSRRFLMTWFRCCHAYGRLARNRAGTRYEGRCPRCAAMVSVKIGPGGTDRRIFETR